MAAVVFADEMQAVRQLNEWAQGLGRAFKRVTLFQVDGVLARVAAVAGMGPPPLGTTLSLVDPTPLRWAVEAASPIIGAGTGPGGTALAQRLGLSTPRAFAVIPLAVGSKLVALAYVDQAHDPLPLSAASDLLGYCSRVLASAAEPPTPEPDPAPASNPHLERAQARARARAAMRRNRAAAPAQQPAAPPPADVVWPAATPGTPALPDWAAAATAEAAAWSAALASEQLAVAPTAPPSPALSPAPERTPSIVQAPAAVAAPRDAPVVAPPRTPLATQARTPVGAAVPNSAAAPPPVVATVASPTAPPSEPPAFTDAFPSAKPADPSRHLGGRTRRRRWLSRAAVAVAVLLPPLSLLSPPDVTSTVGVAVVPPTSSVADIAAQLHRQGIIRSPGTFRLLARISGVDRELRSGVYRLPTGAWVWSVLSELHRGQVRTRSITVPEGLTAGEVATLLENTGFAKSREVLAAIRDPELLRHYGVPARSLEGFLFPETYTFAEGLSARDIVAAMVEQFYARLGQITPAQGIGPRALLAKVSLASIVQREARDPNELARIAGVFVNRLTRDMRLESCATIQYVLGQTKERLTVNDVRKPSPYNTYLHHGLPPGPIANPGEAALRAVFAPEKHDYLFFFARTDGTHRHIFSRTFVEHQRRQRALRESPAMAAADSAN